MQALVGRRLSCRPASASWAGGAPGRRVWAWAGRAPKPGRIMAGPLRLYINICMNRKWQMNEVRAKWPVSVCEVASTCAGRSSAGGSCALLRFILLWLKGHTHNGTEPPTHHTRIRGHRGIQNHTHDSDTVCGVGQGQKRAPDRVYRALCCVVPWFERLLYNPVVPAACGLGRPTTASRPTSSARQLTTHPSRALSCVGRNGPLHLEQSENVDESCPSEPNEEHLVCGR
jgi:hypothetical protein